MCTLFNLHLVQVFFSGWFCCFPNCTNTVCNCVICNVYTSLHTYIISSLLSPSLLFMKCAFSSCTTLHATFDVWHFVEKKKNTSKKWKQTQTSVGGERRKKKENHVCGVRFSILDCRAHTHFLLLGFLSFLSSHIWAHEN